MMTLSLNGHICCLISFQPCICVAILSRLLHRLMIAPSDRHPQEPCTEGLDPLLNRIRTLPAKLGRPTRSPPLTGKKLGFASVTLRGTAIAPRRQLFVRGELGLYPSFVSGHVSRPTARNGTPNRESIGDMSAYTANAYRNNQAKKQTEKTKRCMVTAARDALDGSCELAAS